MKRHLFYILLCMTVNLHAMEVRKFRTQELQRLAQALNLSTDTLADGYSHPTVAGMKLTIHSKAGTVDHIGRQLFADGLRQQDNTHIFDFLERYFLQLQYPPQDRSRSAMMSDDQFLLLSGTLSAVNQILPTDAFNYSYDKHSYKATWNRNDTLLLSVSFPVEYELISGENKVEAEDNLQEDILKTEVTDRVDDTVQWGDYTLRITQLSYGFRKTTFEVPILQWIAFCKAHHCELQYGIEDETAAGDIKVIIMAINSSENYNHVLTIDIPAKVASAKRGIVDARLYPYVPTHNVLNLFGDFRKSTPKIFISK